MAAPPLLVYVHPELDLDPLRPLLLDLGLSPVPFAADELPSGPALLLVGAGQKPPSGWEEQSVQIPAHAPPDVMRLMLQVMTQNAVLKSELHRLREMDRQHQERFAQLNSIGVALSSEQDIDTLQDMILKTCRQLTNADGASLYLVKENQDGSRSLRFAWSQTHSRDVPYREFEMPLSSASVAGHAVISGDAQLLDDAYHLPPGSPFSLNRSFDERHGYRTKSMLVVPMRNHEGRVVGAVQLINAKRNFETILTPANVDREVTSFDANALDLLSSIAGQAAVALDNKQLLNSIETLFEGFVSASVTAIESRDPTTYGHSGRVAGLTVRLAERISSIEVGSFRNIYFSPEQLKELRYASLLHDFGKVGVREHVLVKSRKLYPAQMEMIRARFDFVRRTIQYRHTEEKLHCTSKVGSTAAEIIAIERRQAAELAELDQWMRWVEAANEPTLLDEERASMLRFLTAQTYEGMDSTEHPLLDPEEFHFLSITRGTLDDSERAEIESHVTHSFHFLTRIPWTQAMRNIPEIAYGHHEKLDGSGYPRGIRGREIPIQSRMMTISDIYDALTAQDRPYKRAVTPEVALGILTVEAETGKLDRDLLSVFISERIYDGNVNLDSGRQAL